MIKVALIGAGSVVFSRNLTGDILSYPEFKDATFSYMDVDPDRLQVGAALCRKAANGLGASPTIHATPMSMNMQTTSRTHPGLRAVGLCHSVQGTLCQLMGYLGEDPKHVSFVCAGINHMAFYLRLEKDGLDLYPRLFEAMRQPEVYDTNRVRFELMKRLGYFVTESSEHNAEYSPWFIPHGPEMVERFSVPIDEYLRRCEENVE